MRTGGYPCWLYSEAGPRLIKDEAEHQSLEGDWYESPADIPSAEAVAEERTGLLARAEAVGVAVDKRWGEKRLIAEVEKAESAKGSV